MSARNTAIPSEGPRQDRITLTYDDNQLASALYGQFDENLARLEQKLGVDVRSRGNQLSIGGDPSSVEHARRALDFLYDLLSKGHPIARSDVDGAIRMAAAAENQLALPTLEDKKRLGTEQIATRKRTVQARTPNQNAYMRALRDHELVFGIGPAGTGKTYLAVAHAAMLLETGKVERVILSRPAVEAGERLGFLPGDMKEKVDPYLRPLYDALYDMMPGDKVERAIAAGVIEIAPLAFMRGRTLSHAAIILDEAQNTTTMQMKMFLTRLGEDARMMVNGDPSQIDLPPGQKSGLVEALQVLDSIESIAKIRFTEKDVVRHPLVAEIVEAYDPFVALMTEIDIAVTGGDWPPVEQLERMAERAMAAVSARLGIAGGHELSLLFCDDAEIRTLNARWRERDSATNVLSFPAADLAPGEAPPPLLGDIAIACETVAREAALEGKPFDHHLMHLMVHGILHLLGYDHLDDDEAQVMEDLERAVLDDLDIPDPYTVSASDVGD